MKKKKFNSYDEYKEFVKKQAIKSGHDWELDEDGEIDSFSYTENIHNGFVCKKCGYSYCYHCNPYPEKCKAN